MAVFPVTYAAIFFWLILATYESINIEMKLVIRFIGNIFGVVTAILSMGGERWLFSDGSGNFTLKIVDDGFALSFGIIILLTSIFMIYMTIAAWLDRKKP
jgi:hypothetical protein